jgi:D-amino-acid dehydrogenase
MGGQETSSDAVAVIGAGVIGCAVAFALSKAGQRVLLVDRAEPGMGGASFGNVGHIATEQVEPLPSPRLVFGFWRELFAFDGPLDIPVRRVTALSPWMARFGVAAFRQLGHTRHLAPLVRHGANALESLLTQCGRRELIRRNGHYTLWLGAGARERAAQEARHAARLDVDTATAPAELLTSAAAAANEQTIAGLWFPDTAHVTDPAAVAGAFATAAIERGAAFQRAAVERLSPVGDRIEVVTEAERLSVSTAVVCAGAWSKPLLAPFGIRAPLEAERGYHVELPGHAPLADAPLIYADQRVAITPMASRLRGSSYLEFAGLDAPPDPRKPARLRAKLRKLGYRCDADGPSWMGPRPTLPDYLPGIGRARGASRLFYAVGHQHLGLTLAAVTAELMADLVTDRVSRFDISPFDLERFGAHRAL